MDDPTNQAEELPAAVIAQLRRADRATPIMDPRIDSAILADARRYFAARPQPAARRRWAPLFAAAVAAVVALLIVVPLDPFRSAAEPDDVDGSGRVDILDALALARMRGVDPSGVLADPRIDALIARVVALRPEGGAR
jgi:hypothetical protein